MGSSDYSSRTTYSNTSEFINPKTTPIILQECGIKAVATYLDFSPATLWEKLNDENEKLAKELLNNYEQGLDYKDLIKIVQAVTEHKADLRYNSQRRDIKGAIFQEKHNGLVALKFIDNNLTHWAVLCDGEIIVDDTAYYNFSDIKSFHKEFDGIGHKILFREKQDVESIKNTYSVPCKCLSCEICCRNGDCNDQKYKLSVNTKRSLDF